MAVRHIVWRTGQSNTLGANQGEAGPDLATVPFWKDEIGITASPVLGPLLGSASGGTGADYTIGRLLYAAGYRPIIATISRGATFANAWIPGGAWYAQMVASMTAAWAAIRAAYPGDTFVHHHVMDQGEAEARYGYPAPTGPEQAIINAWGANTENRHQTLQTIVGAPISRYVIPVNYTMTNQNDPASFRVAQEAAAVVGTGDTRRSIKRDASLGVAYEGDGVHPTGPAGYTKYGELFVAAFKAINPMGTLTTFARTSLLAHARNKVAYVAAATHYFHLKAGGAYVSQSGTGYAPLSRTNNATNWPNASGRAKANGVALTWASPTGNWGNVDEVEVTDSATPGAGNILASDTFTAVPVGNTAGPGSSDTGPFAIGIGSLTITAPSHVGAGGFADSVVHSLLNLMFGGAAYSAPATTYGCYFAGDPAGAGTQAGSRVAITQASTWGTAAAGLIATQADLTLAHQGTGTYWAEFDASSSGNLLYCAPRPGTVGAGGTILAGQLQTQIL
jgi:hypothetical protein